LVRSGDSDWGIGAAIARSDKAVGELNVKFNCWLFGLFTACIAGIPESFEF